jgi:hypothetical protein
MSTLILSGVIHLSERFIGHSDPGVTEKRNLFHAIVLLWLISAAYQGGGCEKTCPVLLPLFSIAVFVFL